ncbi:response regulator, partial [bacterium]|nr:response regulator [bacterium]
DNRINQTIMKKMIEHLGYIVRIASDGKEAIQGFRSSLFDAILMDCQMPVMDGYQAATQIRQLENESPETSRIPIIAVTAHAIKGDKEKCIEAGMDDYISKPFTLEQLEEKLHQWVEDPQTPEMESKQSSSTEPTEANEPEPNNLDLSMWDKIQALQSDPNDTLLHDVMENYVNDAQKAIQNLQTSIQNNEAKSIESIAHTLKSSSANVGAMRLSLYCKELEFNSHNNSLENASELYQAIANEYATVKERILEQLEKEPYAR